MRKVLIAIPLLLLLTNCNKKQSNDENLTKASDTNNLELSNPKFEEELKKVIIENDTVKYKKYSAKYIKSGHAKEFLYYAILMAEKNNYSKAYLDIANTLDFTLDDPLTYNSKYASYCLLKAYEMGNGEAKSSINYIYTDKGIKIPKSSSVYNLK